MPEKKVAKIAKQILSALCYLHFNKIIHRNLSPENIMFDDDSDENIKIIGFGYATEMSKDTSKLKFARIGNVSKINLLYLYNLMQIIKNYFKKLFYLCPELFLKKGYDEKCDIWALGVMLIEMLT